jgi:hypothetical protein
MKSIKHYINAVQNRTLSYVNNRRGWKTDRKIVVIESDDWGIIRMSLVVNESIITHKSYI